MNDQLIFTIKQFKTNIDQMDLRSKFEAMSSERKSLASNKDHNLILQSPPTNTSMADLDGARSKEGERFAAGETLDGRLDPLTNRYKAPGSTEDSNECDLPDRSIGQQQSKADLSHLTQGGSQSQQRSRLASPALSMINILPSNEMIQEGSNPEKTAFFSHRNSMPDAQPETVLADDQDFQSLSGERSKPILKSIISVENVDIGASKDAEDRIEPSKGAHEKREDTQKQQESNKDIDNANDGPQGPSDRTSGAGGSGSSEMKGGLAALLSKTRVNHSSTASGGALNALKALSNPTAASGGKRVLSDTYNELGMLQNFQRQIANQVTDQYRQRVLEGTGPEQPVQPVAGEALFGKKLVKASQVRARQKVEKSNFSAHYDVLKVLTFKSITTVCYKQRDRHLVMKRLPKELVELQKFMDAFRMSFGKRELHGRQREQAEKNAKKLENYVDVDLMKPWVELQPHPGFQNFVTCYGVVQIKGLYYQVCDLVEDNAEQPTQKNQYSSIERAMAQVSEVKRAKERRHDLLEQPGDSIAESERDGDPEGDPDQLEKLTKSCDLLHIVSANDKNDPLRKSWNKTETMRQLTSKMRAQLGTDREPFGYRSTEDILNKFIGLEPQKQQMILVNLTTEERAVLEDDLKRRKDRHSAHVPMTYYGPRLRPEEVQVSKNMYEMIKWMDLGNLSGLARIPDYYIRCLIGYIVQVSHALSYAHKHNLVHGQFDLSKVIIQQKIIDGSGPNRTTRLVRQQTGKVRERNYNHKDFDFNFFVTNFEPYQTAAFLQKVHGQDSQYNSILKINGMNVDERSAQQIMMVKDLQAFGNSIVEIMVGRHEEMERQAAFTEAKDKSKILAARDAIQIMQGDLSKAEEGQRAEAAGAQSASAGGATAPQSAPKPNGPRVANIPLDLIPLNWCKMPQTKHIFQILSMCFGPYNTLGSIEVDTGGIFEQINDIASAAYFSSFGDQVPVNMQEGRLAVRQEKQSRLRSVTLNNQAVQLFLNLPDLKSESLRKRQMENLARMLDEACQLAPMNQAALLNKHLLAWQQGQIRDDEFQLLNTSQIYKADRSLARLMYILFKMDVQGDLVSDFEIKDVIKDLEKQNFLMSNIAQQIFSGPAFLEYQQRLDSDMRTIEKHKKFIQTVYGSNNKPQVNQRVDLDDGFVVKDITFSNSECYVVIIGETAVKIIDAAAGRVGFTLQLPMDERLEQLQQRELTQVRLETTLSQGKMLSDVDPAALTPEAASNKESERMNGRKDFGGSNESAPLSLLLRSKDGRGADVEDEDPSEPDQRHISAMLSNSTAGRHRSLHYSDRRTSQVHPQTQMINMTTYSNEDAVAFSEEDQEYLRLHAQFPSRWMACLGNNGKQLAIFDCAQQMRNKEVKHAVNKQENLLVFNITMSRSFIEPMTFKLDALTILEEQEVLTFGFNDFKNLPLGIIYIQAKNLKIYQVNYDKQEVIQQLEAPECCVHKSIFFNQQKYEENGPYYESLKEFIQEQERLGHRVSLPKLNEDLIAVKEKDKLIVKLYNTQTRKIVRQLKLSLGDNFFEVEDSSDEDNLEDQGEDGRPPPGLGGAPLSVNAIKLALQMKMSGLQFLGAQAEKKAKATAKQSPAEQVALVDEDEENKVKRFEISPNACLIAAHIGDEIFIRILNQVDKSQSAGGLDYQRSIPFLPIYQDEDYMFAENKKKWLSEHPEGVSDDAAEEGNSRSTGNLQVDDDESSFFQVVTAKKIEGHTSTFEKLHRFQGTVYAKNERLIELTNFLQQIISHPTKLSQIKFKSKWNKSKQTSLLLMMLRSFQKLDKTHISKSDIRGLQPFMLWDQFDFTRSFETIKDFQCSQNPAKSLLACIINRSLHVYDFVYGRFLFRANLPNVQPPKGHGKKSLLLLDDDQVVLVRDGERRLVLLSIAQQMEIFQKRQSAKRNDDVTNLIDIPKKGNEVDVGFHRLSIYEQVEDYEAVNKQTKPGEDSEEQLEEGSGKMYLEVDFDIENIYQSRSASEYAYVALLGEWRMQIYYVYEEDGSGCAMACHWDFSYRYDELYSKFGKQRCLDFDEGCEVFVTGTNVGWVMIYSIADKAMLDAVFIQNPENEHVLESFDIIRDISVERYFVCYSKKTQHLLFFENSQQQGKKKTQPVVKLFPFDHKVQGDVTNIKIELTTKYMVTSFKNGSIAFYDVQTQQRLKELAPLPKCNLSSQPDMSNIFIDDWCSLVAYLHQNEQRIDVSLIEWQYQCSKLEKPKLSRHQYETKRKVDRMRKSLEKSLRARVEQEKQRLAVQSPFNRFKMKLDVDASKTCSIF